MTLSIDDRRLEHRWIPGDAALPTLVFLHEGLGSVSLWRDVPARLATATGAPTLVYSRLGYGGSDLSGDPLRPDYMHREALETLPAVLDHFRIRRPVLIGHSDGASIALIHAGRAGRPMAGVIAEAPHVFVEDLTLAGIRATCKVWESTDLRDKLGRHHKDPEHTFGRWAGIWLDPAFRDWNIEDVLPGVACPVLVIQGEEDEYGTEAQVEAIARQVSGPARTLMLPDCRHTPHRDKADEVLQAMAAFVRQVA